MKEVLSMKLNVVYTITKEATIEVPDTAVQGDDLDFQAMWDAIYKKDGLVDVGCGEIYAVYDAETDENLYE
jgi:hypothetical protein